MKKFSEQLKELKDRVTNAEMKVATAAQESKEKVEATIQKSKADAETRRASLKRERYGRPVSCCSPMERTSG